MTFACVARRIFAGTLAVSVALQGMASPAPAAAAKADPALDYAACNVADEDAFRREIERLTHAALEKGLANVDYAAVVAEVWRRNGVDLVLDTEVEKAVEAIRSESSWGTLLGTLTSREAAQKLANEVAERTYRSEATRSAIETLSGTVGRELAGRIELATLDASAPAVACVRTFLGSRYGSTITLLVADDTGKAFEIDAAAAKAEVGTGDVVLSGKGLLAGAVVLIVRRSLQNMAKRIGQRVVGAVLGRIVAAVAGGVGLVLIAKDIWDFRHGVLPIIEAEMKSEETKEKVRAELVSAIETQLSGHLGETSAQTADRILAIWREFRAAHTKVVDLAERNEGFRGFVDAAGAAQLPKVDRVVALVLKKEGEAGVLARVGDGTLDEAVKRLPEAALVIAEDAGSLPEGIAWARLAGPDIDSVVQHELHRLGPASRFTAAGLRRLIALEDPAAIRRLASLGEPERDLLSELPSDRLVALAKSLDERSLATLVRYRQGLGAARFGPLVAAAADDPKLMQSLMRGYVEEAVLASRDQGAAIGMLTERGALFDASALHRDIGRVLDGRVHPFLMWERHPASVIAGLLLVVALMLIIRRLFFGGRRRPAIEAGAR